MCERVEASTWARSSKARIKENIRNWADKGTRRLMLRCSRITRKLPGKRKQQCFIKGAPAKGYRLFIKERHPQAERRKRHPMAQRDKGRTWQRRYLSKASCSGDKSRFTSKQKTKEIRKHAGLPHTMLELLTSGKGRPQLKETGNDQWKTITVKGDHAVRIGNRPAGGTSIDSKLSNLSNLVHTRKTIIKPRNWKQKIWQTPTTGINNPTQLTKGSHQTTENIRGKKGKKPQKQCRTINKMAIRIYY